MKKYRKFRMTCQECLATWEMEAMKNLTEAEMEDICWGCECCESVDVKAEGIE